MRKLDYRYKKTNAYISYAVTADWRLYFLYLDGTYHTSTLIGCIHICKYIASTQCFTDPDPVSVDICHRFTVRNVNGMHSFFPSIK